MVCHRPGAFRRCTTLKSYSKRGGNAKSKRLYCLIFLSIQHQNCQLASIKVGLEDGGVYRCLANQGGRRGEAEIQVGTCFLNQSEMRVNIEIKIEAILNTGERSGE